MKIDGKDVLIFVDGEPIMVNTGFEFNPSADYSAFTGPTEEREFRFDGIYETYSAKYIWYLIQQLPRKKKKRVKRLLEKGYRMNVTFR